MKSVAILYIAIGKYDCFWDDFFSSSETFFLTDVLKVYYVFSDSKHIKQTHQVNVIPVKDEGWPRNTLNRFFFFDSISSKLLNHDYCFFFNANTKFLKPVIQEEVIPTDGQSHLVNLSWHNKTENIHAVLRYERNPASKAYIPQSEGSIYYQGGFFGGRTKEFLAMKDSILSQIKEDDEYGIIAVNNDESHLNKYLLDKHPRCLSGYYGRPEEWDFPKDPAIIFTKKEDKIGSVFIYRLKKKPFIYLLKHAYNKLKQKIL